MLWVSGCLFVCIFFVCPNKFQCKRREHIDRIINRTSTIEFVDICSMLAAWHRYGFVKKMFTAAVPDK